MLFALGWIGCGEHGAPSAVVEAPPTLVVLVVVDQLPVRLLDRARPLLVGGLAQLANGDGSFRAVARYPYATTTTCPGHATIATGAAPSVHGIVGNEWYLGAEQRTVYCGDPVWLRVGGIGDQVIGAGGQVAAVSIKDRAALMLGGRQPTAAAWIDKTTGRFTAPLDTLDLAPYLAQAWTALDPNHITSDETDSIDDAPVEVASDVPDWLLTAVLVEAEQGASDENDPGFEEETQL